MDIFQFDRSLPGQLNYSEVFELTDQILQLSKQAVGDDGRSNELAVYPALRLIIEDLQNANSILGTSLGREKGGSPFTDLRAEHDEARDQAFIQFTRRVQLTIQDDQEGQSFRDAAQLIQNVLNDHPHDLHRKNNSENTAELKILLPKLRAANVADAVEQLGLTRFVDRMEEANNAFSDAVEEAAKAARDLADIPTMTEAVRPVRWIASSLLQLLNYGAFKQDTTLGQLVGEIEEAIKKIRSVAQARSTRSSSSAQEGLQELPEPVAAG